MFEALPLGLSAGGLQRCHRKVSFRGCGHGVVALRLAVASSSSAAGERRCSTLSNTVSRKVYGSRLPGCWKCAISCRPAPCWASGWCPRLWRRLRLIIRSDGRRLRDRIAGIDVVAAVHQHFQLGGRHVPASDRVPHSGRRMGVRLIRCEGTPLPVSMSICRHLLKRARVCNSQQGAHAGRQALGDGVAGKAAAAPASTLMPGMAPAALWCRQRRAVCFWRIVSRGWPRKCRVMAPRRGTSLA